MENKDMFRGLGNMYIADERFTAYYEKFAPELAAYYNDAIQHYDNNIMLFFHSNYL